MPWIAAVLAIMLAGLAAALPARAADAPRPRDPALLYDWSRERCAQWDIPDTPARFWRDATGSLHMVAGAEASRAGLGPGLRTLVHDCRILHRGSESADPAASDDRVWIASVFTRDGRHVEALGHAEYHGHAHPGVCAAASYMACWRNAIVALESDDGGASFVRVPGPPVAALPYRYDRDQRARSGYFNPSNMIADGGFLYVFVLAEAYGAQKRGVCLLRRPLDGGPADWRAWDGTGFGRRFADPRAGAVETPAQHVCEPLPGLRGTLTSVVRQPAGGRFLAVSPMVGQDTTARPVAGLWAFRSADLIHWQPSGLLAPLPLLWARDCAAPAAYAYPALVDPDSPARMLDTVGDRFWLTLVRLPLGPGCSVGPERDLVVGHVSWPAQSANPSAFRLSRPDPRDRPQ